MAKDDDSKKDPSGELFELPNGDLVREFQDEEKKIELRLIEDETEPKEVEEISEETEVTRLEQGGAPEVDPSKKVIARKDRDFLNTMTADATSDFNNLYDQNAQWMREDAKSNVRAVPMGWFILLFLIFGGVLFWGALQMWTSDTEPKEKTLGLRERSESVSGTSEQFMNIASEDEQKKQAEARYLLMERTINDYLAADSVEEKLKYARHRERVEPLMRDYYSREEIQIKKYSRSSEYHIVSLDNHPFVAVRAELADGESMAILIEEEDGEFKIDWESEVSYQEIPLEKFRIDRPEESVDLRFYVQSDRFYAYEFQDDSQWRCYKLTARNSGEYFFGYVKRGSLLEEEMNKATGYDPNKPDRLIPLLLRVSYPPAGRGLRSLQIEKIISHRWAYSTNPEQARKD
ncbi:MAG: hypothetical protein ABF334_06845 [Akkermansiaceae bacterium]